MNYGSLTEMAVDPLQALIGKWRGMADLMDEASAPWPSIALRECADELDAALRSLPVETEKEKKNDGGSRMATMGEGDTSRTAPTREPVASAGAGEGLSNQNVKSARSYMQEVSLCDETQTNQPARTATAIPPGNADDAGNAFAECVQPIIGLQTGRHRSFLRRGSHVGRFACKARASAIDPPQDCDWPLCGCDDYASKVLEVVEESGRFVPAVVAPAEDATGRPRAGEDVQAVIDELRLAASAESKVPTSFKPYLLNWADRLSALRSLPAETDVQAQDASRWQMVEQALTDPALPTEASRLIAIGSIVTSRKLYTELDIARTRELAKQHGWETP